MAKTSYSHAFLVGRFCGNLKVSQLDCNKQWKRVVISNQDYNGLCSMYYQSHIDAMVETVRWNRRQRLLRQVIYWCFKLRHLPFITSFASWTKNVIDRKNKDWRKPAFLQSIRHYQYNIDRECTNVNICTIEQNRNRIVVNPHAKYKLKLQKVHLYFFPLNIVLFAIEIDDTNSSVDGDFTHAHHVLRTWQWGNLTKSTKDELEKALYPLKQLLPYNDIGGLISEGNKLKLFQVVRIDNAKSCTDKLLYEIASCSPVGAVGSGGDMAPAWDYYNYIIQTNMVSTFNNWKGLALVDSFTVLGCDYNTWPFSNLYFHLIYLRCLLEKEFCFSRNNAYRLNKAKGDLLVEIAQMEKYYFYNNISHNFQPNLLYQAIAKGLDIKEERELLANQIKEKEETNNNLLFSIISVFAVFSVAYDLYSILKTWLHNNVHLTDGLALNLNAIFKLNSNDEMPLVALGLTLIAFTVSCWFVRRIYKRRRV